MLTVMMRMMNKVFIRLHTLRCITSDAKQNRRSEERWDGTKGYNSTISNMEVCKRRRMRICDEGFDLLGFCSRVAQIYGVAISIRFTNSYTFGSLPHY